MRTKIEIIGNLYYPMYEGEYRNYFPRFKKVKKWFRFQEWDEGGFDRVGIPSIAGFVDIYFKDLESAERYLAKQVL